MAEPKLPPTVPSLPGPSNITQVPVAGRREVLEYVRDTKAPSRAGSWDQTESASRAGSWGDQPAPVKRRGPRRDIFEAPEQEIVGRRPPGPEPEDRRNRRDVIRTPTVNEWRTRIGVASWRGIEFQLETYTTPIGRKSFVHEFAQSDGVFVEDNGREVHYHRIRGFVIGDDYDLQRDNLIRALEAPGPGDLMHPYYGLRKCRVIPPCNVTENVRENRIASFEMTFVDVDEGTFPREITDFPAAVETKTKILTETAQAAAIKGGSLLRAAKPVAYLTYFTQFQTRTAETTLTFLGLTLAAGTSFEEEFASLLLTILDVNLLIQCLSGWAAVPKGTFPEEDNALRTFSTWVRCEIESRAAVLVATTDYPSYDAAVGEAAGVLEEIQRDETMTTDASVYQSLVDIRIFMMQAVYDLASILPRERNFEVKGVVPAIVIAYGLYDTPLRDQEIIARNNIANPNFASGELKVLSR